jgi:aryl-alcohol dehydrogenase-like predicted oxidoreductase
MERVSLGSQGLQVSALTFGGMSLGESPSFAGITMPNEEATRVLDAALDAGIDTIDTANMYSEGESETLLGRWLAGKRDRVVILTKYRFPTKDLAAGTDGLQGLSRGAVIQACDASLTRLATDYIDLFQLHMQDGSVPVDETLRALDDLLAAGKVRHVGCSNFTAYRLIEALWTADRQGLPVFTSIQLPWSLVLRDAERELIPAARTFGLGVLVYSPLARGFLTGKYQRGNEPPRGSRLSQWPRAFDEYNQEQSWEVLRAVVELAQRHETTPAAVALAWLLSKADTGSVIIGVRSEEQLHANLAATSLELSRDEIASLDRLSEPKWGYPYSLIARHEAW